MTTTEKAERLYEETGLERELCKYWLLFHAGDYEEALKDVLEIKRIRAEDRETQRWADICRREGWIK